MASPTRWTWVWVDSGSCWWTGRPGVLRFMGSQRIGHDWATELNWTELNEPKVAIFIAMRVSWLLKKKLPLCGTGLITPGLQMKGKILLAPIALVLDFFLSLLVTHNSLVFLFLLIVSDVQFSHSVMSDSLWPHGLQHSRPPCLSPTPRAYSDSCPLSRWCHPAISSSVVPSSSSSSCS